MIKIISAGLFLVIFFNGLRAQPKLPNHNSAVIWRGFHHEWTYNHRINCLGDFVMRFNPQYDVAPTATHISATGTDADNTLYDSYYTMLSTASASFQEFQQHFTLEGLAADLHQDSDRFELRILDWMYDKT